MMKVNKMLLFLLAVSLLLVGVAASVHAETALTAANSQITWSLIGGSGGYITSSDGTLALGFTAGQAVIGETSTTTGGDTIDLCVGFWCIPAAWRTTWLVFLPITLRD